MLFCSGIFLAMTREVNSVIKWMLIWQILNGGVGISGMTFDTPAGMRSSRGGFGHIPSYSVDNAGGLEKLRGQLFSDACR